MPNKTPDTTQFHVVKYHIFGESQVEILKEIIQLMESGQLSKRELKSIKCIDFRCILDPDDANVSSVFGKDCKAHWLGGFECRRHLNRNDPSYVHEETA